MRKILALALCALAAVPTSATTRLEVQYEACLKHEILKRRLTGKLAPQAEVERAAKSCAEIAPEFAEDIRLSILECGVEPGDSSPDMGCGNEVLARPPMASPDARKTLKD